MGKENQKTKEYDFSAITVEVEFDRFQEMDVSKTVGNIIHKGTDDLGIDEIARQIYKEGKAPMADSQAKIVWAILANSNLLAFIKREINKMFNF
ncbi:MAG: hypothetical protein IJ604_08775 [Prevotella sp.]|nr:hypothetical protein [Prevotella sp.]